MAQKALLVPKIKPVAPGNHPFNQVAFLGTSYRLLSMWLSAEFHDGGWLQNSHLCLCWEQSEQQQDGDVGPENTPQLKLRHGQNLVYMIQQTCII